MREPIVQLRCTMKNRISKDEVLRAFQALGEAVGGYGDDEWERSPFVGHRILDRRQIYWAATALFVADDSPPCGVRRPLDVLALHHDAGRRRFKLARCLCPRQIDPAPINPKRCQATALQGRSRFMADHSTVSATPAPAEPSSACRRAAFRRMKQMCADSPWPSE